MDFLLGGVLATISLSGSWQLLTSRIVLQALETSPFSFNVWKSGIHRLVPNQSRGLMHRKVSNKLQLVYDTSTPQPVFFDSLFFSEDERESP